MEDLNFKPETLKLLEETLISNLQDIGIGKDFLNQMSFAQEFTAPWEIHSHCPCVTNCGTLQLFSYLVNGVWDMHLQNFPYASVM